MKLTINFQTYPLADTIKYFNKFILLLHSKSLSSFVEKCNVLLHSKTGMGIIADETYKLPKYQAGLEEKLGKPFLNLSLHETLSRLLKEKEIKHI